MKSAVSRVGGLLIVLSIVAFFKFIILSDDAGDAAPISASVSRPGTNNELDSKAIAYNEISTNHEGVPVSAWLMNERQLATSLLRSTDVSLLIVPVQGDNNSLDPVERSLITRLLSDRIARLGADHVADPSAVLQYFGTNRSSFSAPDIRRLVTTLKAEEVLLLRAKHDRSSRWSLTATLKSTTDADKSETKTWSDLSFSDSVTPSASFMEIIAEVAEFATGQQRKNEIARAKFDDSQFVFPDSLQDLVERSDESPLYAAGYLQLLGMLHPRGDFNETRDHLFERSLVELEKVSPESPFYRYFKARAYAYLDRRPAAVAVLAKPVDRHEKALLAALNGNLPDLRAYVSGDETSILRFMALKDLQLIEYWYASKQEHGALEQFSEAHPAWAPLLYRSLRDFDEWANYSAATLKFALESLAPAEVISLEDYFEKQLVVGDQPNQVDLTRLLSKHIDALEATVANEWASRPGAKSLVSTIDVIELVKTISVANHLREVEEDLEKRVIPSAALDELNRFESFYVGHPAVTVLKGRVLQAMSKKSTGAEKANLLAASQEAKANGFAWTGRLTKDAATVARAYSHISGQASRFRPTTETPFARYSNRYFEWPKSSAWYYDILGPEVGDGAFQRCIDYMWTAFQCLKWKIDTDSRNSDSPDAVRSDLMSQYADRYLGHPKRDEYAVELARESGDNDVEIRELLSRIEAGSTDLSLYYALGRIYKRRGEYKKAQEAWLSYPAFRANNAAVTLAEETHADNAAAMLFWIGQYELASPLLGLAANSQSGSESSMTSSVRVALINGDLESAAMWSANRVRRYESKYGLRDFLQLLHILGQSELAWNTFDQFQAVTQDSQMWSGALVGHRMESATTDDIFEWLRSSQARLEAEVRSKRGRETVSLAPRYLLMAGTMDRVPDVDFAAMVSSIHSRGRPVYLHKTTSSTPRSGPNEPVGFTVVRDGQWEFGHDPLVPFPQVLHRVENRKEVDHRFTMLAEAMSAFLRNDYATAYESFNETAYYYYLDEYLPYYAFSAAAVGREKHIQTFLAGRETHFGELLRTEAFRTSNLGYRFDEDLSYAALAALSGDHESAMQSLRQALNNRPYLEDRSIYPMYQVVDMADRLFERTGEEVYRSFALDLGRRHTVVLPMYAWAYFIVAKYSDSEFERVKAAASGLHLDPLSHRATKLEKKLLDDAAELLDKNGPRYLKRNGIVDTQKT